MRLGLRGRLTLAMALVLVLAVLALWQRSRGVIADEMVRLRMVLVPGALDPLAADLRQYWRQRGLWSGADSLLERRPLPPPFRAVVLDSRGRLAAVSEPRLRGMQVQSRPDGVMLKLVSRAGSPRPHVLAEEPPRLELFDEAGRSVGTLLAVPLPPATDLDAVTHVQREVGRQLAWPLIVVGALAVGILVTVTTRLLEPLASVAAAARRFGAGDRSARAPAVGSDEVAQLAREFNAMADAVGRAEAARRRLVTDVAHELRTPLTALRAQIEALQDGLLAPDATTLASLAEEVQSLARLIDDLQTLALAESGALTLERQSFAALDLAEHAARAMLGLARGGGVTLAVRGDASATLVGDRERLGQVLRNLLANAVRHAPPGTEVETRVEALAGEVRIAVRDHGPGLTAEQRALVFERFWRADPSRSRSTGGTGLGLSIALQWVTAHGGRIEVHSEPGRGATFTVCLPPVPSAAAAFMTPSSGRPTLSALPEPTIGGAP